MEQWLGKPIHRFHSLGSVKFHSVKATAELETSSGGRRVEEACTGALSNVAQSAVCQATDGYSAPAQKASVIFRPSPEVVEDVLDLLAEFSTSGFGGALSRRWLCLLAVMPGRVPGPARWQRRCGWKVTVNAVVVWAGEEPGRSECGKAKKHKAASAGGGTAWNLSGAACVGVSVLNGVGGEGRLPLVGDVGGGVG